MRVLIPAKAVPPILLGTVMLTVLAAITTAAMAGHVSGIGANRAAAQQSGGVRMEKHANVLEAGLQTATDLEGDLDLDCDVDVVDNEAVAIRFGSVVGEPTYDAWYDVEPDVPNGEIDILDVQFVFGRNYSTCQAPIPPDQPSPRPTPPPDALVETEVVSDGLETGTEVVIVVRAHNMPLAGVGAIEVTWTFDPEVIDHRHVSLDQSNLESTGRIANCSLWLLFPGVARSGCVTVDYPEIPGIQPGPSGTVELPFHFRRLQSGMTSIDLRGAVVGDPLGNELYRVTPPAPSISVCGAWNLTAQTTSGPNAGFSFDCDMNLSQNGTHVWGDMTCPTLGDGQVRGVLNDSHIAFNWWAIPPNIIEYPAFNGQVSGDGNSQSGSWSAYFPPGDPPTLSSGAYSAESIVPDFRQCAAPWNDDTLDSINETICSAGCALTSSVDVLVYWGTCTNPRDFNEWLIARGGYDSAGRIDWGYVSRFANESGAALAPQPRYYGHDVGALNQALALGKPVILGVAFGGLELGHWVVAVDQEGSTWRIHDPGGIDADTLEGYGNTFSQMRIYEPVGGAMRRLVIRENSPVELVITDPEGRRLGFDPRSDTSYDEIPDAFYGEDGTIATSDGQILVPGAKTAWLNAPIDGQYTIEAIGTGTGTYHVDGEAYDDNGGLTPVSGPSGNTSPGQVDTAVIHYTSEPSPVGGVAEYPQPARPAVVATRRSSSASNKCILVGLAAGSAVLLAGAWPGIRRLRRS